MSFAYAAQYDETQPCDRPGARYDRAAWRQEQLNARAAVAEEWEHAAEALRALRHLPLSLRQQVADFYEGELRRFDALLGGGGDA